MQRPSTPSPWILVLALVALADHPRAHSQREWSSQSLSSEGLAVDVVKVADLSFLEPMVDSAMDVGLSFLEHSEL